MQEAEAFIARCIGTVCSFNIDALCNVTWDPFPLLLLRGVGPYTAEFVR